MPLSPTSTGCSTSAQSLTGVMTGLRDRAAADERDLTETERSEIARLQERCVEIDGLLDRARSAGQSARAFADRSQPASTPAASRTTAPSTRGPAGASRPALSPGAARRRVGRIPGLPRPRPDGRRSRSPTSSASSSAR